MPLLACGKCIGDPNSIYPIRSVYVVPQLAPAQLYVRWAPVLEKVGYSAGICFDLIIVRTIPDFERELLDGKPNFAFMNPYHQVMAYQAKGYFPLLADGKNKLDGIIVVKKKSGIESIESLRGAKLAFPAPNAFGASLLVRATLAKQGIDIEPIYVNSHNNVYRSVIAGDVSAGGAVNNTLQREPPEVQDQVRVLFKTTSYVPHPFSVSPAISLQERQKVTQGFLELAKTAEGRRLLDGIQMPDPIVVNYARDYQPLEQLGLAKFVVKNAN
ncbi:phosphate/phosphite/phosphonate ABC transporter substrate-binding protein [Polynucleobacter sp. CS-Odin-A6]|uniref:phosphate/phosphite/phosphonate ABC transporter substrate-binding protein n=1 Tax=Polynucleobacter sp. CS-Odin-A6 TaxID=2689106 RepID=UPI001C0C86BC|nr:phosphate/phosphite/phosphonate ABC transporter substrate-binding protein [Polynucleobacter sp. CS-Odin-A6]MBU3621906.1 phosphate/phosphite/phosphonate ABC transporter substrate-binding protein [Polynucleobacter sp. CS-Odin-A6]